MKLYKLRVTPVEIGEVPELPGTSPRLVWEKVLKPLFTPFQEKFWGIALDARYYVIGIEELFRGGLSSMELDRKIIFRWFLVSTPNATGLIVAHNHPGGDPTPSVEDYRATIAVKHGCELLDIEFIDHIIFTEKEFYSFRQENKL